jgi:flagellin
MRNTQNATSMLQTADGALNEVGNMLVRMKDLATQAADASSTSQDKTAMQSEFDALGRELSNVVRNTSFGGNPLLAGGTVASSMTFQIGASSGETMNVDLSTNMTTAVGSLVTASATFGTAAAAAASTVTGSELTGGNANATIDKLSTALANVNTVRSGLGAAQNRLSHVYNNLSNINSNTKSASGLIMDVDFATESSNMTSNQMLLQAGTAMLKQTNSMSSMVMSLLQ